MKYFVLRLNPEPWALGKAYSGKRDGKKFGGMSPNEGLVAYQNAVKEELEAQEIGELPWPEVCLSFYFWRRLDKYVTMGDKIAQRHEADATNLQKGLEDALQGIMFKNDRVVRDARGVVMEQSVETEPMIVIEARPFSHDRNMSQVINSFPVSVMQLLEGKPSEKEGNAWSNTDQELF